MKILLRGIWQPAAPNAQAGGRPMVGWTRQTELSAIRDGYASTLGRSIGNSINAVNGSLAKRERTDQPRTTQGTLQEAWLSLISSPTIASAAANAGRAGSLSYWKTLRRPAAFQLRSALELEDVRLCRRLANNPISVCPMPKKLPPTGLAAICTLLLAIISHSASPTSAYPAAH